MFRNSITPRPDWQQKAQEVGFTFHSVGNGYWNEAAYYSFSPYEVERLYAATKAISEMCLAAVERVITQKDYDRFHIPEYIRPAIEMSWEQEHASIYGRMDLAYDGSSIKLLEYNADTPTSLFEASIFQWMWKEEVFPRLDQYNSIHESLIGHFREIDRFCLDKNLLHFACITSMPEDLVTTEYLRDCAMQAGIDTRLLDIREIGVTDAGQFVGMETEPILHLFKLYPWEWLVNEEYGQHIMRSITRMIEPPWKMILSNKMILAVLWEMFPGNEYLLPTYTSEEEFRRNNPFGGYARKPLLSREGANVELVNGYNEVLAAAGGDYGEEGYIYQKLFDLATFSSERGNVYPIVGAWLVNHEPVGIGIREDVSMITANTSHFVPHVII